MADNTISQDKEQITIGAAATYAEAIPILVAAYPALKTFVVQGLAQTIGDDIGSASPTSEMLPVLLALEASVQLVSGRGARDLLLEDFFLGDGKTVLAPDEAIQSLSMPKLWPGEVLFCDKVAIPPITGAYRLRIKNDTIEDVRTGFGGLASAPKRASHVEKALTGQRVAAETFERAAGAVSKDFQQSPDDFTAAADLLRQLHRRIAETL